MTADISAFLEPVSEAEPCGPDLELGGDAAFMAYVAGMEGQLPRAYFSFDPRALDFEAAERQGAELLCESRDVRLVVLLAKLAILKRDLPGFAAWLALLAALLGERWSEVNPRGEDGDFLGRMATLYTLDDLPVVILPLQHVPLIETPREGPVSFRAVLVSKGEVRAREGEATPEPALIEKVLGAVGLERLSGSHAALKSIKASLGAIRDVSTERAGFEQAVKLAALPQLVDRMIAFLEAELVRRNPEAVDEPPPVEAGDDDGQEAALTAPAGAIASRADVEGALNAALAYFDKAEPSSAAVLLIRQARNLVGRNLFEVLQLLLPNQADGAGVYVGVEPAFKVPASALSSLSTEGEQAEATDFPEAGTRKMALDLLEQVAVYYRKSEPSSPIPLLLDRARTLASREFLSLLKDLLQEDVLLELKVR